MSVVNRLIRRNPNIIPRKSYFTLSPGVIRNKLITEGLEERLAIPISRTLSSLFNKFGADERLNYDVIEKFMGASGAGQLPLIVGAADIPDEIRQRADVICDGTADQVEINAAIQAYGGAYLYGVFNLTDSVVVDYTADASGASVARAGATLIGFSQGVTQFLASGAFDILEVKEKAWIEGITVTASGSATALTVTGGLNTFRRTSIIRCSFTGTASINDNCYIEDCNFASLVTVPSTSGRYVEFSHCGFAALTLDRSGTRLNGCYNSGTLTISDDGVDCLISNHTSDGDISIDAGGVQFSNVLVGGTMTLEDGALDCLFSSCQFTNVTLNDGNRNLFSGCSMAVLTLTIPSLTNTFQNFVGCSMTELVSDATSFAMYSGCSIGLSGGSVYSSIFTGCLFRNTMTSLGETKFFDNIFLEELLIQGADVEVKGNYFDPQGSGTAKIEINGNGDYASIIGNRLEADSSWTYGLSIAAGATGCRVVNNDFRDNTGANDWGTGDYLDGGTGTIFNFDGGAGNWNLV